MVKDCLTCSHPADIVKVESFQSTSLGLTFMSAVDTKLYGIGIYSIPEAAHLTGVSIRTIRRWVKGYRSAPSQGGRQHRPLWKPQLAPIDHHFAIGFRDLVEVRVVNSFLNRGITWKTIKLAGGHAKELLKTDHPFSSAKMKTGFGTVFVEIAENTRDKALIDLATNQHAMQQVVCPYLQDLEFDEESGAARRWWPLGIKRRTVVIDPARGFGHPITAKEGVPTATIKAAYDVEQDYSAVAKWYQIDIKGARDAVEFEMNLAA